MNTLRKTIFNGTVSIQDNRNITNSYQLFSILFYYSYQQILYLFLSLTIIQNILLVLKSKILNQIVFPLSNKDHQDISDLKSFL